MDDKEIAELKALTEALKVLAKQYDIQIATPSYEVNEVSQYLYGNDITKIVAQSNKILDESSFTAVY